MRKGCNDQYITWKKLDNTTERLTNEEKMEPNVIHWLFIDNCRLPHAERASGHRWSFLRPVSNERQRSPRIGWQCFPRGVNFNYYLPKQALITQCYLTSSGHFLTVSVPSFEHAHFLPYWTYLSNKTWRFCHPLVVGGLSALFGDVWLSLYLQFVVLPTKDYISNPDV